VKDFKVPSPLVLGPLVIFDKKPDNAEHQQHPPDAREKPDSRKLDGPRSNSQYPPDDQKCQTAASLMVSGVTPNMTPDTPLSSRSEVLRLDHHPEAVLL
jgi:hypothetical protein